MESPTTSHCVKVTGEEYELQCKLATENGLMDAGKNLLLKEQEKKKRKNDKTKIVSLVDKISNGGKRIPFNTLFNWFNRYISITVIEIVELENKVKSLNEEIEEKEEMSAQFIIELDEKENEMKILQDKNKLLEEKNCELNEDVTVLQSLCDLESRKRDKVEERLFLVSQYSVLVILYLASRLFYMN